MTDSAAAHPLTTPTFWDEFWDKAELPSFPDPAKRYERCFLDLFESLISPAPGRTIFEAGCAPGMWLSYFHRRFGYRPFGIDTSPKGIELTRRNFDLLGVPGQVDAADFLTYDPGRRFDAVMSLGFIEHFAEPGPVLRRHVDLLAPGGLLILEVPNLTGLNAWLSTGELLAAHNQSVMSIPFFREFAERHGLHTIHLGYIGGFEPDNLGPERSALGKRAMLKALRLLRRLPGSGRLQCPYWSAFLIGIFRKADV